MENTKLGSSTKWREKSFLSPSASSTSSTGLTTSSPPCGMTEDGMGGGMGWGVEWDGGWNGMGGGMGWGVEWDGGWDGMEGGMG